MSVSYLTQEGYDKLKDELYELKTKGREEVAQAIAEARDKGDLSENAEYDAAKDAQGYLEMKINELEKIVASARIIDKSHLDTTTVTILNKVTIKNVKSKMEMQYTLVAESEADLSQKKISIDSPIGQSLLGKNKGDVVDVKTPGGLMQFEIVKIEL